MSPGVVVVGAGRLVDGDVVVVRPGDVPPGATVVVVVLLGAVDGAVVVVVVGSGRGRVVVVVLGGGLVGAGLV